MDCLFWFWFQLLEKKSINLVVYLGKEKCYIFKLA